MEANSDENNKIKTKKEALLASVTNRIFFCINSIMFSKNCQYILPFILDERFPFLIFLFGFPDFLFFLLTSPNNDIAINFSRHSC